MRWTVILVAAILLPFPLAFPGGAEISQAVQVMFDFGTGRVVWEEVILGPNATAWNATEAAAASLDLHLNATWFGTDVFVMDIGDSGAKFPDWWHFLLWTPAGWNLSNRSASAVVLSPGSTVGWFLSRDDPSWDFVSPWPGPKPEATPDHPYPVTTFRYDNRGSGAAFEDGPKGRDIAWTYNTSAFEISGTPAFSGDLIFLPTWAGLFAIDTSGELRWIRRDVAGASSPTVYGDRVYVGGRDGRLHVLDESSGSPIWNLTLQPNPQFSGITASPRIASGRVYVGTFNETGGNGTFFAVDIFTGQVAWSHAVSSIHLSSAAISNGTVFVGLMGRFQPSDLTYAPPYGVLALDADTGEERWFVPTNNSVASSPAVSGGRLYVTTKGGELLAIRLDGAVLWRREIGPSIASPAVLGDQIVVGTGLLGSSGTLWAFGAGGELQWRYPHTGPFSASPTIAGPFVYAATNEREGRVVAVDRRNGTEAWSQPLVPQEYILSSPVVYEGVLYIASDSGWLYALGDGAPSISDELPLLPIILVAAMVVGGLVLAIWILLRRRGPRA